MIKSLAMILSAAVVSSAAPQAATPGTTRPADVSAIYSALLSRPSNNAIYLIAEKTSDATIPGGRLQEIQSCVALPAQYATAWTEILAEFDARKPGTGTIPSDLNLNRPYVLLAPAEVQQFRDERMQEYIAARSATPQRGAVNLAPSANPRFRGATDMFQLSDVYFNRNRTVAVTFFHSWTHGKAAVWRWVAFEKTADGRWQERPWGRCVAEA